MLHRHRYSRVCLRHKYLLVISIDCSLYVIIFSVVHCVWFLQWVFISILGWACDISLQDWPSRALRSSLLGSYLRFRSWSTSSVASQDLLVCPPHVYCLDPPWAQAVACLFRLGPMMVVLHDFSRIAAVVIGLRRCMLSWLVLGFGQIRLLFCVSLAAAACPACIATLFFSHFIFS